MNNPISMKHAFTAFSVLSAAGSASVTHRLAQHHNPVVVILALTVILVLAWHHIFHNMDAVFVVPVLAAVFLLTSHRVIAAAVLGGVFGAFFLPLLILDLISSSHRSRKE